MKEDDIKKVVKEAVQETLILFGFTIDNPKAMQDDMMHLRNLRLGCEATKKNALKAFITVTIPGALYIIWEAFKSSLR